MRGQSKPSSDMRHPGLITRKGWFYFRKVVPEDLRPHMPAPYTGKREILIALRTKDRQKAVAAYHRVASTADETIATAQERQAAAEAPNPVTPAATLPVPHAKPASAALIPALKIRLADQHYRAVIESDAVARADVFECARKDEMAFYGGESVPLPDTAYTTERLLQDGETPLEEIVAYVHWHECGKRRERLALSLKAGNYVDCEAALQAALDAQRLSVTDRAHRLILARAMMAAEIDALDALREDDNEKYEALTKEAATVVVTTIAATTAPADSQPKGALLSDVQTEWSDEKSRSAWNARTSDGCNRAVDLFIEIVGDKSFDEYTRQDGYAFKKTLLVLPAHHKTLKGFQRLSPAEVVAKAKRDGIDPMSVVNANKHITRVGSLFTWLRANKDGADNPLANMTASVKSNIREERDPFTLAELKAIFSAPIFVGCESEYAWKRSGSLVLRDTAKFWLPMLGLYTGCRANEIAKLKATDIRQDGASWYFDINEEPHADPEIKATLKTAASVRQIPVHADLIAFGFLEFVEKRRKSSRLFPELKPDKYGSLADGFGKHFNRFLKSLNIKHDKNDFHSFRHTWTDACRNSRLTQEEIYALKGEALKGTLSRYGNGKTDIEILADATAKLSFKGLDLSRLRA